MKRDRIGLAASLVLGLLCCLGPAPAAEGTKKALAQRDALFSKPVVLDVKLTIDKAQLAALEREPRKYVKAKLEVGDKVYPDVGVHLKGAAGSWRGINDKPGLTINMNKFGKDALCHGMDKFHLANSVQDPTYLNELICGELFRAAGVPASRISHALVSINGKKHGLYYLKEGYDKYFLRHHFQSSDGNFYDGGFLRDIDQQLQLVRGEGPKDHSDLKALVAASREPKVALRWQRLDKLLDLDRFISFLVLESITWDWDGYPMKCNNYRIYHDTKTGKIVFLPSGMDQMFGDTGGAILPNFQGMVAQAVLSTPEGKARYYTRMAEISADVFLADKLSKRLDGVLAAIQPALTAHDKNAGRDYPNQVKRLQQAIDQRAANVDKQLKAKFGERWIFFQPPGEFAGGEELKLQGVRFFPSKRDGKGAGKIYWRPKGETKFASLPLESAGANRFQVTLPAAATKAPFEYYLEVSEGDKAALDPPNGAKGPRLATPDLTPPTPVTGLAATSAKSYRVALAWKAATDDRGVAGYRVYRGTADKFDTNGKALLAKLPAETLAFADAAPTAKQANWYAVRAVDVVGREGEAKYLRVDVPGHEPPADTLKAQATGSLNAVLVSWSGEPEASVVAVEVHRGEGERGAMKKLGEVTDLKKTFYLDKDAKPGTQYRYQLRARSAAGLASDQGKPVTATPVKYLKRIKCGGPRIEAEDGVAWEADDRGHESLKYSGSSVWTNGPNPKTDVLHTERWANHGLGYELKLEPGRYEVVLLFAETNNDFAVKGKRTFDVLLNGKKVAEKVDVFTEAGGKGKPWRLRKEVEVTGKTLEIKLMANPVGPSIKGIEVRGLPAK